MGEERKSMGEGVHRSKGRRKGVVHSFKLCFQSHNCTIPNRGRATKATRRERA